MEIVPMKVDGKPVYAGFWRRVCALLIDGFMLVVPANLLMWVCEGSRLSIETRHLLCDMLWLVYFVYFCAKYEGTFGKIGMDIRIVRSDGLAAGWGGACRRYAVYVVLIAFALVTNLVAVSYDHGQLWREVFGILAIVWIFVNIMAVVLSHQRRTLHDLIGGTVVIRMKAVESNVDATESTA